MVVGIAGKYCAGKDTVARLLADRGFTIIDVDRIGHQVLERSKASVVDAFGRGVLDSSGHIDRRELGRIVFRSRKRRRELEALLHPPMVDEAERRIGRIPGNVGLNAALLFPMGLQRLCDAVIWVSAPLLVRLVRARRRDGLSLCAILGRMRAQRGIGPQFHGRDVDTYSVRNAGSSEQLRRQIERHLLEMGT
jgi:dephospho-CoA kinase